MSNNELSFDIAVIGGGPGGYPAAIKAARSGQKVALIEAGQLGGTCLNRGCIPSKALIAGAEALHNIKQAQAFGIHAENVSFDFKKMAAHKNEVVEKMRSGLEGLIAANRITLFKGYGKFTSPRRIKISGQDNCEITAKQVIIATGSEPKNLPAFPFDHKKIHDSTSMLEIEALPKRLIVVGGGVIGCEFASLYAELGVKVTILEALSRLIPMECPSVSSALTKAFKKKDIDIHTAISVTSIDSSTHGVKATLDGGKTIEADMALVAVGRELNVKNIGLEAAGVVVTDQGLIQVDDKMETSVPGIYAVGDIASRWWLAHVATHQGIVAASNATGTPMKMHYNAVPSVIFTHPEIGTVGDSMEAATQKGYRAALGMFPFQALGKAQAANHPEGFAQIVIDKSTGQVLGAQVVGEGASTLIAEMATVIANELTVEEITHTIHAHPTMAEAWPEAAFVAIDQPLHLPPAKKRAAAAAL